MNMEKLPLSKDNSLNKWIIWKGNDWQWSIISAGWFENSWILQEKVRLCTEYYGLPQPLGELSHQVAGNEQGRERWIPCLQRASQTTFSEQTPACRIEKGF